MWARLTSGDSLLKLTFIALLISAVILVLLTVDHQVINSYVLLRQPHDNTAPSTDHVQPTPKIDFVPQNPALERAHSDYPENKHRKQRETYEEILADLQEFWRKHPDSSPHNLEHIFMGTRKGVEMNVEMAQKVSVTTPTSNVLILFVDDRVNKHPPEDTMFNGNHPYRSHADFGRYLALMYANYHGYDIRIYQGGYQHMIGGRSSNWGKVLVARDMLKEYEYLFYLDSDSWVWNFTMSIEDMFTVYAPMMKSGKRHGVFGQDHKTAGDFLNSGNFILRNHSLMQEFLNLWWEVPDAYPEWAWTKHTWSYEQRALNRVAYPKYKNYITGLPPEVMFDNWHGSFLRHWTSGNQGPDRLLAGQRMFMHVVSQFLDPYIAARTVNNLNQKKRRR